MFRFTAQGRIGKIEELKAKTLRISIAADRLAEGRDGQYTKTEWLRCVSFDADLNVEMLTQLDKGDSVTFEGRIVPTVWMKGEQKIYDNTFEITRYQRLSRPKAKSTPAKRGEEAADAAA
ncbi:MAG: single-stranded DNA-binding protein [Hyphomonadaceae bacterium]|jgi:single-stranded DNA-binding protein